ncbi:MAG: thiamine phosphate synthase [Planctomycetia bacterium]|nr:thiamine phosphate synthase [Planctomycetia bacterium]
MHLDCTPAVERALQAAQRRAAQAGAPTVAPAHLLAELLAEGNRAAALLAAMGVAADAARNLLGSSADLLVAVPEPALPLAADTRQALEWAARQPPEPDGLPGVSSEQLLLALLHLDADLAARLEPLGLDRARIAERCAVRSPAAVPVGEAVGWDEVTEASDAARIVDASANRAREALRVVEDYCRFALDDAFLSGSLKQLRHDLAAALADWPTPLLLSARETQRDVGTALQTSRELERGGLREVVLVNLKRLQEALRSLEEFGKLRGAALGQAIEGLRYRSYTLERAILLGADARQRLADACVYVLLSGAGCAAALDWTIQEAAAGGATVFQLREKHLDGGALLERARQVRRWTRAVGALFIMNDRPDIARLAEADGVHLGQEDLPVKEARRIVGPDALIGVSTHNMEQLHQALLDGASYIGVGPTFPSGTKQFAEFPGLEFVRQASAATSLPAFIIGGVTVQNIELAVDAGARRVAVSQAICQADEPRSAAAALVRALCGVAPRTS